MLDDNAHVHPPTLQAKMAVDSSAWGDTGWSYLSPFAQSNTDTISSANEPGVSLLHRRWNLAQCSNVDRPDKFRAVARRAEHPGHWWRRIHVSHGHVAVGACADEASASWLVRHLTVKYPNAYNVVSFDKLDYCSSLNNARMLESRSNFNFFHGDVTQPSDVLRCLKKYEIDTVFHLAAHTHVDLSFGNSYTFTKNNVLGTHVLLESIKEFGKVKRFYHISTDEVR